MKLRIVLGVLGVLILGLPGLEVRAQDCIPTRLSAGGQGQVLPGDANNLRDQPSTEGNLVGQIPGGAEFTLLEGPVCDSRGRTWWRVDYAGSVGWTVEGQGSDYYVAPVETAAGPALIPVEPAGVDCGGFASRLILERQGRVLPGDPLVVRARPGATGVRGEIPEGEVFTVVGGPECAPVQRVWWQITTPEFEGWLVEGMGDTYFVEPVLDAGETLVLPARAGCPDSLPTRLASDSLARVVPGGANRIRSAPSVDGEILGVIPAEAVFAVGAELTCDGAGGLWRQVEYNRLSGWTIETQGESYFIEPSPGGGILPQDRQGITPDTLWQVTELARVLPEPDRSGNGDRRAGIGLAWSPDSASVAVTDSAGVLVYDVADLGSPPRRFASPMAVEVYPPWFNAVFSPDGRLLAAGGAVGNAFVWEVATRETVAVLPHPDGHSVSSVVFSPDGRWLATGSVETTRTHPEDNAVFLWDTATFEPAQTLPDFGYPLVHDRLTFSPDGEQLLIANRDSGARVLDLATGEVLHAFNGSPALFNPDGSLIFSGQFLYRADTGDVVNQIPLSIISDADFHPDGSLLMMASIEVGGPHAGETGVRLLDGRVMTPLVTLIEAETNAAAFSPDGTLIAVLIGGSLHIYGIP